MKKIEKKTLVQLYDFDFKIDKLINKKPTSMINYHYHNLYELYYLYDGEKYYFINDNCYHIKKGDLVFVNKYDIHYTAAAEGQGSERVLIDFKEDFLKEIIKLIDTNLLECFHKNFNVVELSLQDQATVEQILNRMLHEFEKKSDGYRTYLKAALIQILIIINRCSREKNEIKIGYINQTHKMISEITGYISNHFSEDITLQSIGEQFYISTYYFSRTFKKITGMAFIDYLNNIRIKEAQKLLRKSDMNITQIGEAVGFKNATHFGRVFKKLTGLSPMGYRKNK
ncbi:MAG: helix-turn-helix domain-containing protein [Ruminococcaceae bacterium]|nr:helix-turn-helix domain-containing protein [Oscillospiraceae bacterium]